MAIHKFHEMKSKGKDTDLPLRTKLGAEIINSPGGMMVVASSDAERVSAKLDAGLQHQHQLAQAKKEKKLGKKMDKKRKRQSDRTAIAPNEVEDENLRASKKIKNQKERKYESTVVKKHAEKVEVELPKTPTKKHKRKNSKDEREDARRSPATLKLLRSFEDWYSSSDEEDDDDEMDVVDQRAAELEALNNQYEFDSDEMDEEHTSKQSFIVPETRHGVSSEQLMRTILYPKVTAEAQAKSSPMADGRLSTSKGELLRTILQPKVTTRSREQTAARGHKIFGDLNEVFTSTPATKQQGNSTDCEVLPAKACRGRKASHSRNTTDCPLPIRLRKAEEVVEGWEENPGTVRGAVNGGDDTDMEENIAFSEHYITSKSNQVIHIGRSTYGVVKISPGAGCSLAIDGGFKFSFKLCSVARGGPVLVCLGPKGKETNIKCQEGGMWRVRGGEVCEVTNESAEEVVIFTFVSGEHED